MKEKRINEIKGLVFVAIGLILLASLVSFTPFDLSFYTSNPNIPPKNLIRTFGAYLGGLFLFLFGWASYAVPLLTIWLGIELFRQQKRHVRFPGILGLVVFLLSISSLIGVATAARGTDAGIFSRSGFLGFVISSAAVKYFGRLGGYIIFSTLAILAFVLVTEVLISVFFLNMVKKIRNILKPALDFNKFARKENVFTMRRPVLNGKRESLVSRVKARTFARQTPAPAKADESPKVPARPKIQIQMKQQPKPTELTIPPQDSRIGDYQLPALDLLDAPPPLEARQIKEDLANNARVLEETLEDFGISAKVTAIERGPVITRYELEPAPGVKLNRIVALSDDIALAMKAQSVRIIAPIPGKGRVGVEVPNMQSNFVYLKEVTAAKEFQVSESKLTLALGKDITGQPIITDLTDMPHLLIAGATGSGKTVCVNSLILSLLFKCTPNELKFLMIDPKMVELAPFNGLPHLICPVVNDAKKASHALGWVVNEMEERYRLLAKVGARNIEVYNSKQENIPYIVVIIDELADLMLISRDQIESAITRLAQLSRAVGIHLILATQRPSVDVITGVIKANLPARISFKVASKVDSRTVLDMNGADKLLGKGDLLFLRPGESRLVRIQGSLVTDKEIEKMVDFIRSQAEPIYDEEILKEKTGSFLVNGNKDDLYDEAVRMIMESNQASVSILQRRLRLGYTRAARIIDMMEQDGLIGPFEGSKPRRILVDRQEWLTREITQEESDGVAGHKA
jgi:S-DNA-T family DNA segregation ATPase FtsK/SpoIIIE